MEVRRGKEDFSVTQHLQLCSIILPYPVTGIYRDIALQGNNSPTQLAKFARSAHFDYNNIQAKIKWMTKLLQKSHTNHYKKSLILLIAI